MIHRSQRVKSHGRLFCEGVPLFMRILGTLPRWELELHFSRCIPMDSQTPCTDSFQIKLGDYTNGNIIVTLSLDIFIVNFLRFNDHLPTSSYIWVLHVCSFGLQKSLPHIEYHVLQNGIGCSVWQILIGFLKYLRPPIHWSMLSNIDWPRIVSVTLCKGT